MILLQDLVERQKDRVQAVLNILLESPYFYKQDHEEYFLFLARYTREFTAFFEAFYGWQLVVDTKCARLYKPMWYNQRIKPRNREMFDFTKRNECLSFMLLLEFFEQRLEEDSASVDEHENIKFRFGELLMFEGQRFRELFPEDVEAFSDEQVRQILRDVFPQLEKYRFLEKIVPPSDEDIGQDDTIYECLPALWHYSVQRISRPLEEASIDNTIKSAEGGEKT